MDFKRIYAEMLTHIAVNSHKKPKEILLISDDSLNIEDEVERYIGINLTVTNKIELKDDFYDVVLLNSSNFTKEDIENIDKSLKADGLLNVAKFDYLSDLKNFKSKLELLSNTFKIVMPYRVDSSVPMCYFVVASKLYHPSADIILQRAELIENQTYYNYNLHLAVFDLPKCVYEELKDITKR